MLQIRFGLLDLAVFRQRMPQEMRLVSWTGQRPLSVLRLWAHAPDESGLG